MYKYGMETIRDIIDLWPSRATFASDMNVSVQAVSNMIARNSIPGGRWADLVECASTRGLSVGLDDLARIAAKGRAA